MAIEQIQNIKLYIHNNIKFIMIASYVVLFFIVTLQDVAAQSQNNIILGNGNKSVPISSQSYITIDQKLNLDTDIIIELYQNNLRGKRNNSDVINLGINSAPSWILFSVNNKTNIEDWVLHFGNILDGRMGMAKNLSIVNYSYPVKQTQDIRAALIGSALPIKIGAGINIFVLYIENSDGFPLVIAPKLMSENAYMQHILKGDVKTIVTAIIFLGVIFFFTMNGITKHNREMLALLAYYILLGALFFTLNNNFISSIIINGKTMFLLYIASFIALLTATRIFMKSAYFQSSVENWLFTILNMVIIISAISYVTILGGSPFGLLLLSCVIFLCVASTISLIMFKSNRPSDVTIAFCSGIICVLLSAAIIPLNVLGLNYGSLVVNLFWYLQIPVIFFFIIHHLKSEKYEKSKLQQLDRQKIHDKHSISNLQNSKNSADQARLLRVIDQEKELMTELRQREVVRAEEMRQSKELADKANQDKSAFLAVVSHEIRTPMNGILGMVQLLKNTGLTASQLDYIEIIHKSGDTMMALLNDILDFEKIENGSMDLEIVPFNLKQLANDIVVLMSSHAAQNNITLKAEIDENISAIVMGDPTRLRQVILNLVNNGIKFTDQGYVTIEIKKLSDGDFSLIHFAIKDSGIGISEEAQKILFTPFKQAETSTSRKYGGTGLGLSISYKLIEAMGSKIKVESLEGHGSTFSFDIELKEKSPESFISNDKDNNTTSIIEKITKPMNILIVEDNEMNRKVLEGFLSQAGHTLSMASNGLEALEICVNADLDLILMDIQMDGMSGIEATRKLRADSDNKNHKTPIIAITGSVMLEDIERFFDVGMNGFVAKPIDAKNLNNIIYNASIDKFENNPNYDSMVDDTMNSMVNNYSNIDQLNNDDNELTDIQKYLISTKPNDAKAKEVMQYSYSDSIDDNLDTEMLLGLVETLNKGKFLELLDGFIDKSYEIIENMEALAKDEDITSLGNRAHELKGMSSNFGMKKVSAIAKEIEKYAKMSDKSQTINQTKKLNIAINQTKAAFDKWLDDLSFG